MPTNTHRLILVAASLGLIAHASGCRAPRDASRAAAPPIASEIAIARPANVPVPPFQFSREDEQLLDEIQHGAFLYLWTCVAPETGMVLDRSSKPVVSVAGVGFQLSAIPIGIERGWISRDEGRERALKIIRAIASHPANRVHGVCYHYLDGATGGPSEDGYESVVSTIDGALLLCGVITVGSYFGGEVRELGDRLVAEADWAAFVSGANAKPWERGFVSLGWKPRDVSRPTGDGEFLPYFWLDSGDEQRLVTFMGVAAPRPEHRLPPPMYYRMRRALGEHAGIGPIAWFPWSGALFTSFFAHCWIDYAAIGLDNPSAFGVERRARVDWWENSRRHVQMHQAKARENPAQLPTFGENAWGLTACDAKSGYLVPGLFPSPIQTQGCLPEFDVSTVVPNDNPGDGTIAPYGAGCAVMFDPARAVTALRFYRSMDGSNGTLPLWRSPADGGTGFADSFNLGTGWVAKDQVAIDQGPLVLAIENARTGRVWSWFAAHPTVQAGFERLGWERDR